MNFKPSFLHQNRPLNTCMIQVPTAKEVIEQVRNIAFEGCDAYGLQVEKIQECDRTEETLKNIFAQMDNKPCYVTNYRSAVNAGKTDDKLAEELLYIQSCGGTLFDVIGDLYAPDPLQLTMDENAVAKQKELIQEIHHRGGEVLVSSHTFQFMSADDVVRLALAQQERGADVCKIVGAANSEEEELENLRIVSVLKKELDVPFLFLCSGTHNQLLRTVGPMLGCNMWLTVLHHDTLSTKQQPVCRAIRAIQDNFSFTRW